MYLDKVIARLNKHGYVLTPCKRYEVANVEEELSIKLPVAYKEFLLEMGKNANSFMVGSSCYYDEILYLKGWADELLEENKFKALPNNCFVFWMHQGYQFAFFFLDAGDDPPVYYYSEVGNNANNPDFILTDKSFSSYLDNVLSDEIKIREMEW